MILHVLGSCSGTEPMPGVTVKQNWASFGK